ncbi:hypothetical protein GGR16_000838 [Chelatococcus caeni]|uniref:Uncharacterized protein n=1 Tax=Chelatococcus caeni TaxID=1348468 RepID=A0A840BVU9_9HYPH|nr:hypothetical protein [Chelatococcus caeni]MBB4015832.1 hypothetical protein [Chelatococcus caeni]
MPSLSQLLPFSSRPSFQIENASDRNAFKAPFVAAYENLRSVDGIDDFASLLGMSLPQLQQAIATLAILGVATPFVAVGAKGAIDECTERFREDFPQLLQKLHEREEAIIDLLERSGTSPADVERIKGMFRESQGLLSACAGRTVAPQDIAEAVMDLARSAAAARPDAGGNGEQPGTALAYQAARYARDRSTATSEKIDRNFSIPTAAAMTGMTGGMVLSMADSVAGIVEGAAPAGSVASQGAATAGAVLGTAATAAFLPSQLAMAAVGASKCVTGVMRHRQLKGDRQALQSVRDLIDPAVFRAVEQGLKRLGYYNKHHSIVHGAGMAAGQSLMAAGSIASLTGVAGLVGVLLAAVGAPLTVGAAVEKIVYEKKEARFRGEGASELAHAAAEASAPDELVRSAGPDGALAALAGHYADAQGRTVMAKLHRLIDQVLAEEKPAAPADALSRREKIAKRVADLATSRRTGLLPADVMRLAELFHKDYPPQALAGAAGEVRARLRAIMDSHPQTRLLAASGPVQKAIFDKTMHRLIKDRAIDIAGHLNLKGRGPHLMKPEHLAALRAADPRAEDHYLRNSLKVLSKQEKKDGKLARDRVAQDIIAVARGAQLAAALLPEAASRTPAPAQPERPSSPSAPSRPATPHPAAAAPAAAAEDAAFLARAQAGIALNRYGADADYIAYAQRGIDLRQEAPAERPNRERPRERTLAD